MTLWHIDDFQTLRPDHDPFPWTVIGVLPTVDEYRRLGEAVLSPSTAFCYTVSAGPQEVWCPLASIEGRYASAEMITIVINVILTAVTAGQLTATDNMIVPVGYTEGHANGDGIHDAVFWIGETVDDPDHDRYHCYQSPHTQVLPVRWSSPMGFPD